MDFPVQESRAGKAREVAREEGKTCIDGHLGIAQPLPEGWDGRCGEVVDTPAAGELDDGRATGFAALGAGIETCPERLTAK